MPELTEHSASEDTRGPQAGEFQFSSVAQLCLTLCDPMNCSTGLPVHHQLRNSPKLMSIELVMPSNHLILCRPLLLFCILDVEAGDNPLPVLVGEERDRKWRPWLPLLRGRVLNKDLHGGP